MSAFESIFWEPDFYVSPLKGTIFVDIFGPIFGGRTPDGRTDGHTDVTNGRTAYFLTLYTIPPSGAMIGFRLAAGRIGTNKASDSNRHTVSGITLTTCFVDQPF